MNDTLVATPIAALIALQKASLEPVSAFSITFTLDMIVASVIGGIGTIVGPILGAFVIYFHPPGAPGRPELGVGHQGLLIIAVIRFAPRGLWGVARDFVRNIRMRVHPATPDPLVSSQPERFVA